MNDENPKAMKAVYLLDLAHQLHHRVVNGGTQGQYLGELNAEILRRIESAQAVAPGGGLYWLRAADWDRIALDMPLGDDLHAKGYREALDTVTRVLCSYPRPAAPASEAKGRDSEVDRACKVLAAMPEMQRLLELRQYDDTDGPMEVTVGTYLIDGVMYEVRDTIARLFAENLPLGLSWPAASSAAGDEHYPLAKAIEQAKSIEQAGELPPLPPVDGYDKRPQGHYSADQMHAYASAALLRRAARVEVDDAARSWHKAFKNFHRSLCKRFGYCHDEIDWSRDQVSLEEHIASKLALAEQDGKRLDYMLHWHATTLTDGNGWRVAFEYTSPATYATIKKYQTQREAIDAAIAAGEGER